MNKKLVKTNNKTETKYKNAKKNTNFNLLNEDEKENIKINEQNKFNKEDKYLFQNKIKNKI